MFLPDSLFRPFCPASQAGAKIPWNEPRFSERILREHLAQDHDLASRRQSLIRRQVACIAQRLTPGARVLDLGCGPGFHTALLAEAGFRPLGVDFSPASIAYAKRQARERGLAAEYVLEDIRAYTPERRYDAVLLLFGEINVFTREEARRLVRSAAAALSPGGTLFLEAHTFDAVRRQGEAAPVWQALEHGLFSDTPHLLLQENAWDAGAACAASRYIVLDAANGSVAEYAAYMEAYSDAAYRQMLGESGFTQCDMLGNDAYPVGEAFVEDLHVYACRYEQ